jgi:hypothetical protein
LLRLLRLAKKVKYLKMRLKKLSLPQQQVPPAGAPEAVEQPSPAPEGMFQQEALLLQKVWRRQKQHQIFNQLLSSLTAGGKGNARVVT